MKAGMLVLSSLVPTTAVIKKSMNATSLQYAATS
jgi:hypothetical protein